MTFGNSELRQLKRTRRALHRDYRLCIRWSYYDLAEDVQYLLDKNAARIEELEKSK